MSGVLIVDDFASMRNLLRKAVEFCGVPLEDIHDAFDGVDALEKLETFTPDLILSDLNMPRLDGEGLLRAIRERGWPEGMQVVMITSQPQGERTDVLLELGAAEIIRKPFNPHEIPDLVGRYLGDGDDAEDLPFGSSLTPPPGLEDDGSGDGSLKSHLDATVNNVFQQVAYMEAIRVEPTLDPDEQLLVTDVAFSGAFEGTLVIACNDESARELAFNLTGDEPEDDIETRDALGEVANILIGQLLHAAGDGEGTMGIGHPVTRRMLLGECGLSEPFAYQLDDPSQVVLIELTD